MGSDCISSLSLLIFLPSSRQNLVPYICLYISFVCMYTHRKKLSIIIFFSVTKAYKLKKKKKKKEKNPISRLSPDGTEYFRASIWNVCLAVAKIIEVRRISCLSYGEYKMS